ncbi:MAG: lamin tail domain-containing protein, partial [Candidatus Promineifilaceae bacterium]
MTHKPLFWRLAPLSLALILIVVFLSVPAAGAISTSLVINEIDYDQDSTDLAEFLEIKNVSAAAINLDTWSVELVNGTGGGAALYQTIDLPNLSLAAGDYYVVCANPATVANCDLDGGVDSNFIQNGSPDAIGLRDGATLVDAVSYEGDTGAPYTEGSGAGLEDNPSLANSGISRCPDGADSDQNNADLTPAAISPGAANDCPAPPVALTIMEIQGAGHTSPYE